MVKALIFLIIICSLGIARADDKPALAPIDDAQLREAAAITVANQITSATNAFVTQVTKALTEGMPGPPPVKADDVKAKLGPDRVKKLEAALHALNGK